MIRLPVQPELPRAAVSLSGAAADLRYRAPILIRDLADPRIEPYRNVRDRDIKGRRGSFMAEGEVVLRTLLSRRSRFRPSSILLSETRAAALVGFLREEAGDVTVYVASASTMDEIAGFPIHRGVLALVDRGGLRKLSEILPAAQERALVLGLAGISNHDNVGGAFRNAAAFGADAVLLDGRCCDPLYRKSIRVSVGTALTVPFWQGGTASDMIASLADAGFEVFGLSPDGDLELGSVAWPARTALLVGAEGTGLPSDILARVPSVRIDMADGLDSLNVATASGIALHSARVGQAGHAGD